MEGFPEVVTRAGREEVSRGHPRQGPSVGRQRWRSHSLGTCRDSTVTLESAGMCGCGGTSQVVCGGPGEPLTAPWVMEAPEHSGQPWMVASEHTSEHGNECADVHTGRMQRRAHA